MSDGIVRVGLVGLGNMGSGYVNMLPNHPNVKVVSVCDVVAEKAQQAAGKLNAKAYTDYRAMFHDGGLDAIVVAVPHYDHTPITVDAFAQGLHVLCEKPIAVHVNDAKKMIAAYEAAKVKNPHLVFGISFQERTLPAHKKLKDLLDSGMLGRLTRVTWINTQWFRSQLYYDSGTWRATWAGEGGGILTNQCPHNLDLYQWLFGMPARIRGFAHIGKYHNIEVEDEVTAYFEHDNGMIGHFIVSTAETPGTNRLEIVGEHGTLVYEQQKIVFYQNRQSMLTFTQESPMAFGNVESWHTDIPIKTSDTVGHPVVIDRFVKSILNGHSDLIADGPDGIYSLTLANAIMLSSFIDKTVELPIDADEYERVLNNLIQTSTSGKTDTGAQTPTDDFSNSFSK